MYKVGENRKCTEWPQTELEHLTVKRTLYTIILNPEAQTLVRFTLRLAVSDIHHNTRSVKIGNTPNDPKLNLHTQQAKWPCIHYILTPEAQILVRFTLRLAVSEIKHVQGRQKSEMHRMTPHWPWILNSQKYSIYNIYLPLRSKFWPVSLYD